MIRIVLISLVLTFIATGCTTKARARREAQAAYEEGKRAALAELQAQSVTINGPVQNPKVPWVAGLTLSQALATANYVGVEDPEAIVITRHGESAKVDPQVLFNGVVVPLEPGDVIEIY
jgi:hypothetical protein